MVDLKISELTAFTELDGSEELAANDGGTTKKITTGNFSKNIGGGSFTIYRIGSTYFARDNVTGVIDYSGSVFGTVIQGAVDDLAAGTGGLIKISDGNFVCAGNPTVTATTDNIFFEGNGDSTILDCSAGDNLEAIRFDGTSTAIVGGGIRNLKILGDGAGSANQGVSILTASEMSFDSIFFQDCGDEGIVLASVSFSTVTRCKFKNCKAGGGGGGSLGMQANSHHNLINNNVVNGK